MDKIQAHQARLNFHVHPTVQGDSCKGLASSLIELFFRSGKQQTCIRNDCYSRNWKGPRIHEILWKLSSFKLRVTPETQYLIMKVIAHQTFLLGCPLKRLLGCCDTMTCRNCFLQSQSVWQSWTSRSAIDLKLHWYKQTCDVLLVGEMYGPRIFCVCVVWENVFPPVVFFSWIVFLKLWYFLWLLLFYIPGKEVLLVTWKRLWWLEKTVLFPVGCFCIPAASFFAPVRRNLFTKHSPLVKGACAKTLQNQLDVTSLFRHFLVH